MRWSRTLRFVACRRCHPAAGAALLRHFYGHRATLHTLASHVGPLSGPASLLSHHPKSRCLEGCSEQIDMCCNEQQNVSTGRLWIDAALQLPWLFESGIRAGTRSRPMCVPKILELTTPKKEICVPLLTCWSKVRSRTGSAVPKAACS
jgi:hypothetical protein